MIVVKAETEVKSSSPINISTPSDQKNSSSTKSFGELLRGVKVKVDNGEENKAVVLAFDEQKGTLVNTPRLSKESKPESLDSLLKGDAEVKPLELNPKITENLSVKEIKNLISNAKKYLKEQILNSDGYKKSQIKELPKTLKGLAQLAKKFGINISKITLESVQVKVETRKVEFSKDSDKLSIKKSKVTQNKDLKLDDTPDIKSEIKIDKKSTKSVKASTLNQDTKQNVKADTIKVDSASKLLQTPIFKAQTKVEVNTTEQVVIAKQFQSVQVKTPKDKADETLKLLLRGERSASTNKNLNLTADFSVATAKVIAPTAKTESNRTLESLLRGDSQTTEAKSELSVTAHKADSFEVKINEAKQMIKYISTDVKQALDDYKYLQ